MGKEKAMQRVSPIHGKKICRKIFWVYRIIPFG